MRVATFLFVLLLVFPIFVSCTSKDPSPSTPHARFAVDVSSSADAEKAEEELEKEAEEHDLTDAE